VAERILIYTDKPVVGTDELSRRYLQTMAFFNGYKRAEASKQAFELAEMLEKVPEGRRGLHPFYLLAFQLKLAEHPVDAVSIFERGEIDVSKDTETLGRLGEQLSKRGIVLDYIYCDNENDLSVWTLGDERIKEVYRSEKAKNRFPPAALRHDVSKLKFMTPEYHEWLLHFGSYAQQIKIEGIRKVLIESGLMSPWGERTMATNFYGVRTSFRIYDLNGWEYEWQTLVDTRTSCPVCMPAPQGQRYAGRVHHRAWNSFIDLINHARSAGATGPINPIIREPFRVQGQAPGTVDPGARWYWDQLMGHLIRTGASTYMMFHEYATAADDRAIAEIVRGHEAALPAARPVLPEIRLDVDEVVTGDWRTTYSDFLRQEPDRWLQQF